MRNVKTIATTAASAALVLFGGLAAVQQQAPPRIDVDSLSARLGLSSKEKAQIAPQVDQLNALLARRDQMRQEHQRLWTQFQDVQQKIAGTLTPEQQRGFMLALARAGGYGPGTGYGPMGYGHMGYGAMGPGYMGRGMGYGHMRHGHGMGWGRGSGGWMMGQGSMMGARSMWGGAHPGGTTGSGGN